MYSLVKCKKCRKLLLDSNECTNLFLNSHQENKAEECSPENVVFLNEDNLPQWILNQIEGEQWLKGRLTCQYCDAKIGAFDFVSGLKCDCSQFSLPAVHFNKSKVDLTV